MIRHIRGVGKERHGHGFHACCSWTHKGEVNSFAQLHIQCIECQSRISFFPLCVPVNCDDVAAHVLTHMAAGRGSTLWWWSHASKHPLLSLPFTWALPLRNLPDQQKMHAKWADQTSLRVCVAQHSCHPAARGGVGMYSYSHGSQQQTDSVLLLCM